jgi:hypothetical protein
LKERLGVEIQGGDEVDEAVPDVEEPLVFWICTSGCLNGGREGDVGYKFVNAWRHFIPVKVRSKRTLTSLYRATTCHVDAN